MPTATAITSKLLLKAKRATKATNPSTLAEIEAYYNRRIKVLQERLDVSERKLANSRHLQKAAERALGRATAKELESHTRAAEAENLLSKIKHKSEGVAEQRTMERLKQSLHQAATEIESCKQKIRDAQSDPLLHLPIGGPLRREFERVKRRYKALLARQQSESEQYVGVNRS